MYHIMIHVSYYDTWIDTWIDRYMIHGWIQILSSDDKLSKMFTIEVPIKDRNSNASEWILHC